MLSELRIVLGLILHLSSFSTVRNRTPQIVVQYSAQ
ncbi:hypothetical protein GYH30_040236 [Glycine max]|nr:hypothetical protein GYH30_040236 [Glycine max]